MLSAEFQSYQKPSCNNVLFRPLGEEEPVAKSLFEERVWQREGNRIESKKAQIAVSIMTALALFGGIALFARGLREAAEPGRRY